MTAPIVIVAPCPLGRGAVEGWMSRIRSIDRIFEGQRRIYLDFVSGDAPPGAPQAVEHGEASEYRLDMARAAHRDFVEALIRDCRFAYVHTVHLARFLLPYYMTGKIVTDVHGIVPEEERMLGRPEHGDFYEAVEATVVIASRLLVVVTEAMRDHLQQKYPDCRADFVVLPIIERHAVDLAARRGRAPGEPYRAVYAGGTQAWQNIDDTLAACAPVRDICRFDFLSHEHEQIAGRAAAQALGEAARFRVVDKAGLAEAYLAAEFGFVLRDPVAVNTVSCPTKLSEYLWFGVIPVVKSPSIGDFERLGYAYLTMQDFAAGLFPDEGGLAEMRVRNRAVIEDLATRFGAASELLAALSLPNRIAGSGLAGLPVGHRHLVFPSQAEVYLFADAMVHRVRAVAAPYDRLEMRFDPPQPARSLRIVPLLSAAVLSLREVTVTLEDGAEAPQVSVKSGGPVLQGADGTPVFRLPGQAPYIDLHLGREARVAALSCRIAFERLGPDAEADPAGAAPGRPTLPVAFLTAGRRTDRAAPVSAVA
jgi:hypothetical protein